MRRFLIDAAGNYVFFVPTVGILAGIVVPLLFGTASWTWAIFLNYALASLFIAPATGRAYSWFLLKIWYPRFGVKP